MKGAETCLKGIQQVMQVDPGQGPDQGPDRHHDPRPLQGHLQEGYLGALRELLPAFRVRLQAECPRSHWDSWRRCSRRCRLTSYSRYCRSQG